jgi:hypothetical protein
VQGGEVPSQSAEVIEEHFMDQGLTSTWVIHLSWSIMKSLQNMSESHTSLVSLLLDKSATLVQLAQIPHPIFGISYI